MKVGFTGTQNGMTAEQLRTFGEIIKKLRIDEFHHGDCVGADKEAVEAVIYVQPDVHVVCHPPENPSKRAFTSFNETRDEKPYLVRNHDIVDECGLLIATPWEYAEELRSGTWATIRYARKSGKRIVVIYPDGTLQYNKD